jgi:hypothetical protein
LPGELDAQNEIRLGADQKKYFWLAMTLIAALAIFAVVLAYPFCSDLSTYQWMAIRLVHDGALPYVGSWDHNFPGIILFHFLSIRLFGNSELGFRIIEALFQVVTAATLYYLLLHWFRPRTAFLATLFYGLGVTSWGVFHLGQRDEFAAGLLIWALAMWKAGKARPLLPLLSGLLFGFSALIRPTYFLPAVTLIFLDRRSLKLSEMGIWITLLALPLLLSILPYLATGTFDQYYDSTILFNLSSYQAMHSPISELLSVLRRAVKLEGFAVFAFVPRRVFPKNAESPFIRKMSRQERMIYAFILSELVLLFAVQRKFGLAYQLIPFVALLSPLAAIGLERILLVMPIASLRNWAMCMLIAAIFVRFSPLLPSIRAEATGNLAELAPFIYDPVSGQRVEDEVENFLAKPGKVRGAIEVVAFNARLRAKLERTETTRFTVVQSLVLANADGSQPEFQKRWRREFISKIVSMPARFVIIGKVWGYWTLPALGPNLASELPELDSVLRKDYLLDTTIGAYAIYRIKNDHSLFDAGG